MWTGIVIATSACVKNDADINSATDKRNPLLSYGTLVNIIGEVEISGGLWYKVLFQDGSIGYIYSYYIERVLLTAKTIVDTSIHEYDGIGSKVIATLQKGTSVAIISVNKSGTWGFDAISRGWVHLEFIN